MPCCRVAAKQGRTKNTRAKTKENNVIVSNKETSTPLPLLPASVQGGVADEGNGMRRDLCQGRAQRKR
jgi:hypothetical protein